jgi:AraC family transcriptional regulator, L-rhamnose operon regulatory protein RhaS
MHPGVINYGLYQAKELPLHRNLGLEVVYVIEGTLLWQVDGRRERVLPKSFFFTLPWQAHGGQAHHEPGNRIAFVQFKLDAVYREPVKHFAFHPELNISTKDAARISTILENCRQHSWPATPELADTICAIVRNMDEGADPLAIEGMTHIILAEMISVVSGSKKVTIGHSASEKRVQRLLEAMREQCDQEWDIRRMTDIAGMGCSLMTDIVKTLTGDTPMIHLNRLRIEKAEILLKQSELSITHIAQECGFTSSQHFARAFKKFTNHTPSDFRKQSRQARPSKVLDFTIEDEMQRHQVLKSAGSWI